LFEVVESQFLYEPRMSQWDATLQILQYLKKYPGKELLYIEIEGKLG